MAPPPDALARVVRDVLTTPFPYAAAHVATGPADCDVRPERLHPAFHGSLDWHSSCHMQWSAIRLLDAGLSDPLAGELAALLDDRLRDDTVAVEVAYLRRHPGFERPYGWAWGARLAATARLSPTSETHGWGTATLPLADVVAEQVPAWLHTLASPVRHGVHSNTAFALALCRDAFIDLGRSDLVATIDTAARRLYAADRDYPASWEPSGNDFLSGALCEADLLRRVLGAGFGSWLAAFLPGLGAEGDPLLAPPVVLDDTDGHLVHAYGLALSRAAHLRTLAAFVPPPRRRRLLDAASALVEAASPAVTGGHFMSAHWLVSFSLLAADSEPQA